MSTRVHRLPCDLPCTADNAVRWFSLRKLPRQDNRRWGGLIRGVRSQSLWYNLLSSLIIWCCQGGIRFRHLCEAVNRQPERYPRHATQADGCCQAQTRHRCCYHSRAQCHVISAQEEAKSQHAARCPVWDRSHPDLVACSHGTYGHLLWNAWASLGALNATTPPKP